MKQNSILRGHSEIVNPPADANRALAFLCGRCGLPLPRASLFVYRLSLKNNEISFQKDKLIGKSKRFVSFENVCDEKNTAEEGLAPKRNNPGVNIIRR